MSNVNSPLSKQKFRLHPLIHPSLEVDLVDYIVCCEGGLLNIKGNMVVSQFREGSSVLSVVKPSCC
jgi:hypothetical protein